ncbi:MAG: NADH-quinone oxidoreductase subunit N, partial [Melioribacteraceae bacterium]|nr:NADH-quinone oxidoreductase subunit N [Melioribacteraceae bacterium]
SAYFQVTLSNIIPEISVAVFLMLIVGYDLIFNEDKKLIPYLALLGLFVTGLFVIKNFGHSDSAFFITSVNSGGMVAIDAFASYFKLMIILASVIVVFFSMSSKEIKAIYKRSGEYYALMFGMVLGMMLMVSAIDLILIYLSVELLSLSSYVLAGFTKLRDRNSEASLKYIIYGSAASGMMLFGISILYGLTGVTNLNEINIILQTTQVNIFTLSFAVILIFVGLGFKASAVPFHFWTPDVYEGAPISITAYLSVASKAAAIALLVRFVRTTFVGHIGEDGFWDMIPVFDWQTLLIVISLFTMTLGNLTALWQKNLKRLFAYSAIAHAGYLLLGVVVLSDTGIFAMMMYLFAYLLMNLGAFYVVMLISDNSGSESIDDINGIGFTAPLLAVPLTIFLVSLAGIPPTFGFIAKLNLFIAVVDANLMSVVIIALLNVVVSVYYYSRILKHMYFNKVDERTPTIIVGKFDTSVVLILAALIVYFGVFSSSVYEFVKNSVKFF